MTRNAAILTFLLCLIIILPSISFGQYAVGDTVNNFTLNDIDGGQVTLYDLRGEVVFINFFRTT